MSFQYLFLSSAWIFHIHFKMNVTTQSLTLAIHLNSPWMSVACHKQHSKFSFSNLRISQFSHNFLLINPQNSNIGITKSRFDQFLSPTLVFNGNLSKTTEIKETLYPDEEVVLINRTLFSRCYSQDISGGAISFIKVDNQKINISECGFFDCSVVEGEGGAIYSETCYRMRMDKTCFKQCKSFKIHNVFSLTSPARKIELELLSISNNGHEKGTSTIGLKYGHLHLEYTNVTFNTAIRDVLMHVDSPNQLNLAYNNFALNKGESGFFQSEPQKNQMDPETWCFMNVYQNNVKESVFSGAYFMTVSDTALIENTFEFLLDLDDTSMITFEHIAANFLRHEIRNRRGDGSGLYMVKDESLVINTPPTTVSFEGRKDDFCWAFPVQRIFTPAVGRNAVIYRLDSASQHPHLVALMALLFVLIIVTCYYLLQRKATTRVGMTRVMV